ncbi:peptidylglycine alpha-hydroxylating monooxygenase-like [Babylonia areolata]|uniref:peptidylglycine alpha-hydroxylating monooxygenase-like n=1 Tax=Babylonia areolata TaxID=304850 RepID=UPI003FD5766F
MIPSRIVVVFCCVCTYAGVTVQVSAAAVALSSDGSEGSGQFELTVRMPNATSDRPDALVCHSHRLPKREAYILRFVPHASMKVAHHMMVYGCSEPGTHKPFWSCPRIDQSDSELSICGSGQRQIVFAWANDAPSRNLPDGVGFRVAGTTGIDYLVIQLHYVTSFGEEAADSSGVTMVMTHDRQPQQAGYYVLGNMGMIPPQKPEFHMESMCEMNLNYTIYPIGYRTHGHNIAVVTSGYHIRDGVWTELGRMSPQRPQTFYNITSPGVEVHKGDILASRCTFNSMSRANVTKIGKTNADEMCNFYILYSTYEQKDLTVYYCFRRGDFHWGDYFHPTPVDASSLQGIPGAAEIRRQFHMDPRREAE